MELTEFIGVIRKWKWLILPIVLVATVYTALVSLRGQESYSAETMIVVGLSKIASSSTDALNLSLSGKQIGSTYSELITTEEVMQRALDKAGLDWQPQMLSGKVSVDLPPNTSVMKVTVTDSDLDRALLLTTAVSEAFIEYIEEASGLGFESAKAAVQDEIASVEADIAALPADDSPTTLAQSRALQVRRESAIKKYEQLLDQQAQAVELEILNPSRSYSVVKPNLTQRTLIAFGISLIVAIALAFLAEAIQKAVRPPVSASSAVFKQSARETSPSLPLGDE